MVLRFNGCHLDRNLLDTTHFLCFCLGLVLKIFTRYCNLGEVVSSGFVGKIWITIYDGLCTKLLAWFQVSFMDKELLPADCVVPLWDS